MKPQSIRVTFKRMSQTVDRLLIMADLLVGKNSPILHCLRAASGLYPRAKAKLEFNVTGLCHVPNPNHRHFFTSQDVRVVPKTYEKGLVFDSPTI